MSIPFRPNGGHRQKNSLKYSQSTCFASDEAARCPKCPFTECKTQTCFDRNNRQAEVVALRKDHLRAGDYQIAKIDICDIRQHIR